MPMLCTLANYRLLTGESASADSSAEAWLAASSAAIRIWLRRDLTAANQQAWLEASEGTVYLPEWPVNRVRLVGGTMTVGRLSWSGSRYAMPAYQATATGIRVSSYVGGSATSVGIAYADHPTLSSLKTAIEINTGWTLTIEDDLVDYPSSLVKPSGGSVDQGANLDGCAANISWTLVDDCGLYVGSYGVQWIYVDWDAGYAIDDGSEESSSSESSETGDGLSTVAPPLPEDIAAVCAYVARDIQVLASTEGGIAYSETIGDYSYSIDPNAAVEMVNRYRWMLDKYRRLDFKGTR